MKTIVRKSLIFLSVFTLLLAGYSAQSGNFAKKKEVKTEKSATEEQTIVKAVSFEATPSIFQGSVQRFSILLFSFEFNFETFVPQDVFFPNFLNIFKQILFKRISPVNAP